MTFALYCVKIVMYEKNTCLTKEQIDMVDKLKGNDADELFKAILQLKTVDECYALFEDLCTIKELQSMTQRFVVAKMLREKRVYSDIVEQTGASTATISRVNRSLLYGKDGYELVLERLKEAEDRA